MKSKLGIGSTFSFFIKDYSTDIELENVIEVKTKLYSPETSKRAKSAEKINIIKNSEQKKKSLNNYMK